MDPELPRGSPAPVAPEGGEPDLPALRREALGLLLLAAILFAAAVLVAGLHRVPPGAPREARPRGDDETGRRLAPGWHWINPFAERVVPVEPESLLEHPRVRRAAELLREGRNREAIAEAAGILAADRRFVPALLVRGLAEMAAGDLENAGWSLKAAAVEAPDSPEVLIPLSVLLERTGDPHTARLLLEHAREVAPERPEIHINLAALYGSLGLAEAEERAAREAARLDPGSVAAWTNLGLALRRTGNWAEAEEAFGRAAALDPASAAAHANRGEALLRLGRFSESRFEYEAALALQPDAWDLRNALAAIALLEGRREDAIRLWRESLLLRPDQPEVLRQVEEATRGEGEP